jgi:flagellar biosynthesis protein FlhG
MSSSPSSSNAAAWPGIEPAHSQYIEQEFRDLLQGRSDPRLISEIHRALFLEGKSPAVVRNQLSCRQRSTKVIAVTSGKGGVGKTTLSVNLAVALAGRGRRVLLFDADLGMANVHIFAGVTPRSTLLDFVEGRCALAQILTAGPGGVQIACGASGVAGLADLSDRVVTALGRELVGVAGDFDHLVIDTGAGISAQVLHFLMLAHEILVVTTPNLAAILDAYGVVKVAREARMAGRISVIVNQAADETEAGATFDRLSGCARRFLQYSPSSLGFLSRDAAVEAANQSRQPLVLAQPASPNSRRIAALATSFLDARPAENAVHPTNSVAA